MIDSNQNSLIQAVEELRSIFPEMRFGQLVANLTTAAGCTDCSGPQKLDSRIS